jgi:signal transduction histidine kinase
VIGTIDEKKLDRRVAAMELPAELRPMAEKLNEMLARLEREFVQRKQFLADTAHELRTPVAAILTRLEVTLRRPREAGALTDALRIALSDVRLLRRLVDALLEQVRNDRTLAGKEPMCVDVSALLEQCATLADSLACAKEVTIERKFAAGLLGEFQLVGLQSIITNLLANAVQYSPVGSSIELSASAVGNQLQLSVRDCGPGIDPDVLPHIFEPFYRGDSAHNGNEGHLGLGLFLVQSHAKAMGGRCEVDTAVGMGCVFRVWLPLSPADSAGNLRQRVLDRSNEFKVTEHGEVAMES